VAIGSGGAVTGLRFILDRLPYAQGLQFEQQFYRRNRLDVVSALTGAQSGSGGIV
jgi:hypothetical protein